MEKRDFDIMKNLISDVRTAYLVNNNENFRNRLFEAYQIVKSRGITTYEEFENADTGIGAFTFSEIMFFDRITDTQYKEMVDKAFFDINNSTLEYAKNPQIGDQLAKWGSIGNSEKGVSKF
jgi:hypothetical protein